MHKLNIQLHKWIKSFDLKSFYVFWCWSDQFKVKWSHYPQLTFCLDLIKCQYNKLTRPTKIYILSHNCPTLTPALTPRPAATWRSRVTDTFHKANWSLDKGFYFEMMLWDAFAQHFPHLSSQAKIYFSFPGELLMRMLKMLILPLITSR